MDSKATNDLLILGKPGCSKTTFLTQLTSIARKKTAKVSFWKNPENIEPLKRALDRLRVGDEASGTNAESNTIIHLPIRMDGQNIDLQCPDYGGEQIRNLILLKEVTPDWLEIVKRSDNWLLFIRLSSIDKGFDLTTKNANEAKSKKEAKSIPEYKLSEEVSFVELLQILLYAKGLGLLQQKQSPKITIALTCWDELQISGRTPAEILQENLPLFNQFIYSQWAVEQIKVIGVSAQGMDLSVQKNKLKYINEGNDKFPFVIPNGSTEKINDLTYVLHEALK